MGFGDFNCRLTLCIFAFAMSMQSSQCCCVRLCVTSLSLLLRELHDVHHNSDSPTSSTLVRPHQYEHLHGWPVAERDPQMHDCETWAIEKRSLD